VLKTPLIAELADVFQQVADRQNRHLRRLFNATSGGAVKIAADFVNALYAATFEGKSSDITVDAFTTSFSTHSLTPIMSVRMGCSLSASIPCAKRRGRYVRLTNHRLARWPRLTVAMSLK